jgi:hypothetical protein
MLYDEQRGSLLIAGSHRLTGTLYAKVDGQRVKLADSGRWHRRKKGKRPFCFLLELTAAAHEVRFQLDTDKGTEDLDLLFDGPNARLNSRFWAFHAKLGDLWALSAPRSRALRIALELPAWKLKLREAMMSWRLNQLRIEPKAKARMRKLRKQYWADEKAGHRPIWLYYDKGYKGGDNGEYLFRYAAAQDDGIDHRYIINSKTSYAKQLVADGLGDQILGQRQEATLLAALEAERIVVSHKNRFKYVGFTEDEACFFTNLMDAKIATCFHGLNIPDVPRNVGQNADNSTMTFIASPYERTNLLLPENGFADVNLKLLGAPRFDGLVPGHQPFVLLSPTWRRYIVYGRTRSQVDEAFADTDYFKIFDSLINNRRLLDGLRERGMGLIYLLHPMVASNKDAFGEVEGVEIVRGDVEADFERLLSDASVMVTDYSGVQFDFAYMRKPLLYYHREELPDHTPSPVFNYSRDGLGPILTDEESLVDAILDAVDNGVKPKYRDRMDHFFAYDDQDSCARIYSALRG